MAVLAGTLTVAFQTVLATINFATPSISYLRTLPAMSTFTIAAFAGPTKFYAMNALTSTININAAGTS